MATSTIGTTSTTARRYLRRQNGGGSVMVWGTFSDKSKLAILRGRQHSGDYIYTISEYLLPYAHSNHGTDFVFQQDNASIHASRETKSFRTEMEINTMEYLLKLVKSMPRRCLAVIKQKGDLTK
ncbi:LOW QUALITY PROTEIN: hypothetical protein PHPALM_28015 [Phytophthora palmivora]|uniref:Transposase n=1 Tax=Phytophthora palmivora TaxID=4796 RepID=A0A2P4XB55_9STRA|nr:LOW QUALITY PROTEIN: hypothetical protein PHPALM_28015 [Phytophthora palmivora]